MLFAVVADSFQTPAKPLTFRSSIELNPQDLWPAWARLTHRAISRCRAPSWAALCASCSHVHMCSSHICTSPIHVTTVIHPKWSGLWKVPTHSQSCLLNSFLLWRQRCLCTYSLSAGGVYKKSGAGWGHKTKWRFWTPKLCNSLVPHVARPAGPKLHPGGNYHS